MAYWLIPIIIPVILMCHLFPHSRVTTDTHRYLPYLSCLWLTENSVVCAGYDCYPVLWSHDDSGALTYINKLDQKEKKAEGRIR